MASTRKFDVLNRWSGKVQFTAEIECSAHASTGVKIGLAVRWAYSRGADLRDAVLRDAVLSGAVLRDAVLRGADLRDAVLRDAVLRGADLRDAVLRDAVLRGAVLRDADLSGAVLRDADLSGADLSGADLSDAVLRDAVLRGADLRDAVLRDAVLRGADLRDAVLRDAVLRGIPIIPNIDMTILAAIEAGGNLDMSAWHRCKTTHCRAGWAIHLAGETGAELERQCGSAAAGALIYAASRPDKPVPNFYAANDEAMADLKACAAEQAVACGIAE